jgi:hypothetical protein
VARPSPPLCDAVQRGQQPPRGTIPPTPVRPALRALKKDGGTLEGITHNYSAPERDGAVTSGQWERSPPPPSALCGHPGHCTTMPDAVEHAATGHRHASHRALYGLLSTAPSNPHADGPRTSNLNATPPQSRSCTGTGHAVTPRQKRDSPGQSSTPWHCTSCLYT